MLKELQLRLATNQKALLNIEQKSKDIIVLEQKWALVKALSNTANGNISGKEKIMLETYVQMAYFERILQRANVRFMVMSEGQYELARSVVAGNNRSQSGLELDVIDHYNGTRRSVKTLSGGESFKASLSLALGLSDEVQSRAGGIRLDTMFVDEGFGSLDEESLEQAIKARERGADYLGVGAVFPTGSKDDAEDVSYDTLKAICQAVDIPVIAIGGITKDNVKELSGSGICGIAVISAIFAQKNIEEATAELKEKTLEMIK